MFLAALEVQVLFLEIKSKIGEKMSFHNIYGKEVWRFVTIETTKHYIQK